MNEYPFSNTVLTMTEHIMHGEKHAEYNERGDKECQYTCLYNIRQLFSLLCSVTNVLHCGPPQTCLAAPRRSAATAEFFRLPPLAGCDPPRN